MQKAAKILGVNVSELSDKCTEATMIVVNTKEEKDCRPDLLEYIGKSFSKEELTLIAFDWLLTKAASFSIERAINNLDK